MPSIDTAQPAGPRDRILDTASRLFYAHGLRAVGVDRLIAESGVAKASFYKHFPSKNDLIVAFLRRRHQTWMAWFAARLHSHCAGGPSMAAVAGVLREWFEDPAFHGCAFINAMAEDDLPEEARRVAQSHKEDLRDCLEDLARESGVADPALVADEALLIVEGAIVRAHMTGTSAAADLAAVMLGRLVPPKKSKPARRA
jgi:AcrR family transcriptional regulator